MRGASAWEQRAAEPREACAEHRDVARFLLAVAAMGRLLERPEPVEEQVAHQLAYATEALATACGSEHKALVLTFAADTLFVRGVPLIADEWVHLRLEPIARAMAERGWNELRVDRHTGQEALLALARNLAPKADRRGAVHEMERGGIRALRGDVSLLQAPALLCGIEPQSQCARAYAEALVAVWAAARALERGAVPSLRRLRRAASNLAGIAEQFDLDFTQPIGRRIAGDEGARGLDAALTASACCAALGADRSELHTVALATLLLALAPFDSRGIARSTAGPASSRRNRRPHAPERVIGQTATFLVGMTDVDAASVALALDAQRHRFRRALAHAGNASHASCPQARLVSMALRFHELLSQGSPGRASVANAIASLEQESVDADDRSALCALVGTVGVIPRGTTVRLDSGDVGMIVDDGFSDPVHGPTVEVLTDGVQHGSERRGASIAEVLWAANAREEPATPEPSPQAPAPSHPPAAEPARLEKADDDTEPAPSTRPSPAPGSSIPPRPERRVRRERPPTDPPPRLGLELLAEFGLFSDATADALAEQAADARDDDDDGQTRAISGAATEALDSPRGQHRTPLPGARSREEGEQDWTERPTVQPSPSSTPPRATQLSDSAASGPGDREEPT